MFIADLHIHSKYSRATSRDCVPQRLDWWARRKGLGLIGTGDFTHPAWREELREACVPAGDGLYTLRESCRIREGAPDGEAAAPRFILSGEISSIYKKNGRVRKVHNVILLPSLEDAQALAQRLELVGNLHSDGRPILGLDSRDLLEITLEVCPQAVFIPAHIWTPHFSLFGAYSGFDRIEECFEDLTPYIHAVETGLSSDPPMNWRLSALDGYTLVSNSDAHSPSRLAREANLLDTELSYPAVKRALETGRTGGFRGTIEFFPEEGKYHYDGHRNCRVCLRPSDTVRAGGICPVCGRKLTVGVLHRVEELADRPEGYRPEHPAPFESLVPLDEVVGASTGCSASGVRVQRQVEQLLHSLGPELSILREVPLEDIERQGGPLVAEGIRRLREGRVDRTPGYDGAYGKIGLLSREDIDRIVGQTRLFAVGAARREAEAAAPMPTGAPAAAEEAAPKPASEPAAPYGLNAEQWEAVSAGEPAVAVLAGPGTGKTRTLVFRIVRLLEQGVSPARITAVTFTNRAAREMRERLEKQVGKKTARRLQIGTFHAVCLSLLEGWGIPVRLLDEGGALALAEEAKGETGWAGPARELLEAVAAGKRGKPAADKKLLAACEAVEEKRRQLGALDYDDLLLETLRLLEEGKPLPAAFSRLLVDEFQDIDEVQYRLIRAWSRGGEELFVIGDPDQSIYGFRGADPRCFARLAEDRPGLRQIRLRRNYRSTPEILACALPVIAADGGDHALTAEKPAGAPVGRLETEDSFAEALFVAKEINRLVGGVDMLDATCHAGRRRRDGMRGLSDIAVLYRTHRQAEVLETCLKKEGIPYTVAGREDTLADPQVRRAVAAFRWLLHPEDQLSLRVLLGTAGPETARKLAAAPENTENAAALAAALRREGRAAGNRLAEVLEALAPAVKTGKPLKLLEDWVQNLELEESAAFQRFLHMAALHERMEELLWTVETGTDADVVRASGRQYAPDAVSLMTLHASKGLEFPVVFLCGVQKGRIPLEGAGRTADREEERRLLYVGMTRAMDELVVLSGGEPSPFLADIPPALFEKEDTARRLVSGRQLSLFD